MKNEANQNVYNVGYTWSTTAEAAGTQVYYTHEKNEDADKIYIPGPTNAHLYVYVSLTSFKLCINAEHDSCSLGNDIKATYPNAPLWCLGSVICI